MSESGNAKGLQKFEMTEEILSSFRENKIIPVNFFNRDGQILIPQKEGASSDDIRRLHNFEKQGVYFRTEDLEKITGVKDNKKPTTVNNQLVSYSKLVNTELTKNLADDSKQFLQEAKTSPINGQKIAKIAQAIENILNDFSSTEDLETGLVNIIEVMKEVDVPVNAEIVTKRTVVAMALKIRGMKAMNKEEEAQHKKEQLNLMLSSYLCDIGMTQMKPIETIGLSSEGYEYIKNHPIISYLLISNIPSIDTVVKFNVLNHHRPYKGEGLNNNYPETRKLIEKLLQYRNKYAQDLSKSVLVNDIALQIKKLTTPQGLTYEEDANVISIASEFASLTTKQVWRDAFTPIQAMKIILNNSYFIYNERIIRSFFDHIGLSLCNNKSIINIGDYVIAAHTDSNKNAHYEICIVESIHKEQTRPVLERVGSINPTFKNQGKIIFEGFDLNSLKIDKRKAKFNLLTNDPRRVIYIIDPELTPDLFEVVHREIRKVFPGNTEELINN